MDIDEYERMIETGERPGVRFAGYIVLASLISICSLFVIWVVRLLG